MVSGESSSTHFDKTGGLTLCVRGDDFGRSGRHKVANLYIFYIPVVGIVDMDLVYRDSDLSNGQSSLFLVQGSANMVGGEH